MNALLANIDKVGQNTIGSKVTHSDSITPLSKTKDADSDASTSSSKTKVTDSDSSTPSSKDANSDASTSSSETKVTDANSDSLPLINLKLPKGRELKPDQVPNDEYVRTHELYGLKLYNPKGIGLCYQILNTADRIFNKHHIQYWAEGGTVLGAIRHGGHIPWDDDEDICVGENFYLLKSKEVQEELAAAGLRLCQTWFGYKLCPIKTPSYGVDLKAPDSEALLAIYRYPSNATR